MVFHKNPGVYCWQSILLKYHTLFFFEIRKDVQNLSSAAAVNQTLPTGVV